MKHKNLLLIGLIMLFSSLQAQTIANHALGLRLGDNGGVGTEISYQMKLSDGNRLEGDLGWASRRDGAIMKLTGLYQWVRPFEGHLNYYYGAGAGLVQANNDNEDSNGTNVFAAGILGLEYLFALPIQLALDLRPELNFGKNNDALNLDLALSIRYLF